MTGNPGVAVTSFTQAQVSASQVVFVDDGDEDVDEDDDEEDDDEDDVLLMEAGNVLADMVLQSQQGYALSQRD